MTDPLHAVPEVGTGGTIDKPRIEAAVREILEAIGEDPEPRRPPAHPRARRRDVRGDLLGAPREPGVSTSR